MHSAEIVVSDEQRDRRLVVTQLFAEPIGQTCKPALLHPQRQIAALDVACGDVAGPSAYYVSIYPYYLGRRVAARCASSKLGPPASLPD